jgi:hypothetical protein
MVSRQGISRRHMLVTSAAAAGGLALGGISGAGAQGATRIDAMAPELDKIISTTEPIRELVNGLGGPLGPVEGPVWWKEGGYLLFSDIHASKRMKYTPGQGVSVFKDKTNQANGLTRDLQGRLLDCEHETRRAGAGRQPHRDRQQLPGPPPQPPERRGGEVRRQHLFHRPLDQSRRTGAVGPYLRGRPSCQP